jgi:hypothetical protein
MRTFRLLGVGIAFASLGLLEAAIVQADAPQLVATLIPVKTGVFSEPWATGSGKASVSLGSDAGTVCFELQVADLPQFPPPIPGDTFVLWILPHAGGSAVAVLDTNVRNAVTSRCVTGLAASLIGDLFTNPQRYDIEVADLNQDAAGCGSNGVDCVLGGIRGQLRFAGTGVVPSAAAHDVPNTATEPSPNTTPSADAANLIVLVLATLAIGSGAWLVSRQGRPLP